MMVRRWVIAAVGALLVLGGSAWPAAPGRIAAGGVRTVVHGVVASAGSPGRLVLEDGRVIVFRGPRPGSGIAAVPGDEVVAVGSAEPGGRTIVVAAGSARVVRHVGRAGRTVAAVDGPCTLVAAGIGLSASWRRLAAPATASGEAVAQLAHGMETEIMGTVVSVGSSSFTLRTATLGDIQVIVNAETELVGFAAVSELKAGDTVRVRGDLSGTTLTASRVELMDMSGDGGGGGGPGHGSGVGFESAGSITALAPPDRFSLSDGRSYRVDGNTVFEGALASYADLAVGQLLEVRGAYSGAGEYRAVRIELEGEMGHGQGYRELDGSVQAVSKTGLTLNDGTPVLFVPATVFDGDADRWQDIEPGWEVRIDAMLNMAGQFLALDVRATDPSPATTAGQEFEPHEALLVLADGADPAAVAAKYGAAVEGTVGSLGILFRWDQTLDDELLARVTADADVLAVEPNYLFRDPESSRKRFPVVDLSPTEDKFRGQPAVTQIQLDAAALVTAGTGTVVAVMDTGVDPCNPLLVGRILAGGLDTVDGDLSPWETRDGLDEDGDGDIDEAAGHGSFVASMVALAAPGARILPYRVLDDDGGGTAYDLALALADAIDRGVDVINLSLTYHERSTVVDLLLEEAAARGIVVVAAAGNDAGTDLPFPAVDSHVLAVTALAADGATLASFANRSPLVPLAAPGEDLYGALDRGFEGTWSGSSMAAPLAAAGAALLKSLDPTVDPAIVRQALTQGGSALTDGTWSGVTLNLTGTLALIAP